MNRGLKLAAGTLAAAVVTGVSIRLVLTPAMYKTLLEVYPRTDVTMLALVLPLTFALNLVRAVRFSLALGIKGAGTRWRLFEISSVLVFLGFMIPFKIGELSFPVMAKRAFDQSYATSLGALAYSRVTDLFAVIAIGGFALTTLWRTQSSAVDGIALPAALACTTLLLTLPFLLQKTHALGTRLTKNPRVLAIMERLYEGCRSVATPRRHVEYLGLTLAIWALLASAACVTMRAMGVESSLRDGVLANTAASITFALPVSGVAGVGPIQASWAYALTLVGWKWEVAVANALLSHATMVTCAGLLSLLAVTTRSLRGATPSTLA